MSVYKWCIECASRIEGKHEHLVQYRADFLLGGRHGTRIRKLFSTEVLAEEYEDATKTDFKRGLFIPTLGIKARMPFSQFADEYFEKHVKHHLKGSNVERYRLNVFKEFWGTKPLHSISANEFTEFSYQQLSKGREKTTVNRMLVSLKSMFQWAVTNSYILDHPFKGIKKFNVDKIRVRWLSEPEIETLIQSAKSLRDYGLVDIILVALNTGFRKENLKQLTSQDILDSKRVQATRTKSGKSYDVPINDTLEEVLGKLCRLRNSGPLLDLTNIRRRWDALIKFSKLDTSITLHTLRHTFASQCLKKKIPIDRVSKWMGHYSLSFTLERYGHLCPNQEAEEINQLNLGGTNEQVKSFVA